MTLEDDIPVGSVWESRDKRDGHRRVEVVRVRARDNRVLHRNVKTGRMSSCDAEIFNSTRIRGGYRRVVAE